MPSTAFERLGSPLRKTLRPLHKTFRSLQRSCDKNSIPSSMLWIWGKPKQSLDYIISAIEEVEYFRRVQLNEPIDFDCIPQHSKESSRYTLVYRTNSSEKADTLKYTFLKSIPSETGKKRKSTGAIDY